MPCAHTYTLLVPDPTVSTMKMVKGPALGTSMEHLSAAVTYALVSVDFTTNNNMGLTCAVSLHTTLHFDDLRRRVWADARVQHAGTMVRHLLFVVKRCFIHTFAHLVLYINIPTHRHGTT
jgi:hypothetical protein